MFIYQVTECCPILPTLLAKLTRKVWWRTPRPYRTREAVSSGARWSGEPASPSAAHGETATESRTRRTSLSFPRHLACLGTCEKIKYKLISYIIINQYDKDKLHVLVHTYAKIKHGSCNICDVLGSQIYSSSE